jgi:hypothetical protein
MKNQKQVLGFLNKLIASGFAPEVRAAGIGDETMN